MKKNIVLFGVILFLIGCGEPKSVDYFVKNKKSFEETYEKCNLAKKYNTFSKFSEKELVECENVSKAKIQLDKMRKIELKKKTEERKKIFLENYDKFKEYSAKCEFKYYNLEEAEKNIDCYALQSNKLKIKEFYKDKKLVFFEKNIDKIYPEIERCEKLNSGISFGNYKNIDDQINCSAAYAAKNKILPELKAKYSNELENNLNEIFPSADECAKIRGEFGIANYSSIDQEAKCQAARDASIYFVSQKIDEKKNYYREHLDEIASEIKRCKEIVGGKSLRTILRFDDINDHISCMAAQRADY
ncbi:hypothetical protein CBLAS_1730 [Campylobacter blaseri]|uniref:Uncharacterized protein n=1 Tax=Campylobacter blaseri TaxID=2042961 RepID=A0A2P8R3U3_9BACT|nr:EexN family lipoprotein [Campylobacter blaseri]PSM53177.1 hypothetical protein CQ405_01115 [Campylobacter blaseri]PSM54643.1 hypothetical protein CRN67_01115 [Campylobacter blaseri]QKF86880.1 hypothetical protein CBLAS_1730 [Campylobacter blaseri]